MARAFVLVMDSAGIGGAPDAAEYFNGPTPDTGANTIGHIAQGFAGGLRLPTLARLGLGAALELASGLRVDLGYNGPPQGLWGAATERSRGKDTPSGHWEIAGQPVPFEWHVFPNQTPAFPPEISALAAKLAGCEGILGNCYASGTEIIERLGAEHMRLGWPICYTSVDSVFQIAAHEERFGLARLLALCEALAPTLHAMGVGRVIARPFLGHEGAFIRTPNRRDYAIAPPAPTLLDHAFAAGRTTHAIGKIGDIFAHRGITALHKGKDDAALFDHLDRLIDTAEEGSLTFANFVEFDSLYGHRRDLQGYGRALQWFDARLGAALGRLKAGDLLLVTADHGNDPSFIGTDHTRERVPVLGAGLGAKALGHLGFADIGASVADHLGLGPFGHGTSFLRRLS